MKGEHHQVNDYHDYEPQVFIGFSELEDEDYETEKKAHIKDKKKKGSVKQGIQDQADNGSFNLLLGNKRKQEQLIDIEVPKKKLIKRQDNSNNVSQEQSSQNLPDKSKMNIEPDESKSIPPSSSQKEDNLLVYSASNISIDSMPLLQEACYFIKDINLSSITIHSYDSGKETLIRTSSSQKALIEDKEMHYIPQINLNNLSELKRDLEAILGGTKLWYNNQMQSNIIEGSYNILSHCRYDVIGITIGKAVLLPERTVYHLSQYDIVNFRTVIINLGPGTLNHSIIAKDYTQSFINYYQHKYSQNSEASEKPQRITKEFLSEANIPYQFLSQDPYNILVLEPGIIHWCNSANLPSLVVHWSLFQQSSSEYNKISLINKQIAALNSNPLIPLLALRFDLLIQSLDYLPLESIKSDYIEMQNIIKANSLEKYKRHLIEAKVGLIKELPGTKIFFCDICHTELFNYYSVNKRTKKASCLKCLFVSSDSHSRLSLEDNVIIYKYSQNELDGFLNRMRNKMMVEYDNNSNVIDNNMSNNNTNSIDKEKVPFPVKPIGFQKQVYKKNLGQLIDDEGFDDDYVYSYETYALYEDLIQEELNYPFISNYLIHLIDKDKEKTNFSDPLLFSNKTFPYSDFEDLTDANHFKRFSPPQKNNLIQKKKEANNALVSMFGLQEKQTTYSKPQSNLVGSSIFDYIKKSSIEVKSIKKINYNVNDKNQGKYKFADDNDDEKKKI